MRCNGFSPRSVRLNAAGALSRRPRGRRRKQRAATLGDGGHGRGHAAAASRSRRGEGRMRTMRVARLSSAIVAPTFVASALAGCAPVGPNFVQPAAIVSPEYKEIKGWKIATPRQSEPKGEWWTVFRDPELGRLEFAVTVSNQTVKADEANYRAGACADRRGARRPLSDRQRQRLGHAFVARHPAPGVRHEPDRRSVGRLDPRRVGAGEARDRVRQAAGRK